MGYKSPIHLLDLPDYVDAENPENSLVVKVVAPSIREGADLNAGRRTIAMGDGTEREETSEEYMRRAFSYLAPKIRFWNYENEDGARVRIPRDLDFVPDAELNAQENQDRRLRMMVDHLYDQDENIILAIYHAWRLVSLPKKADTDEGKDSGAPSTPGPDASPRTDGLQLDLMELERSIPMG